MIVKSAEFENMQNRKKREDTKARKRKDTKTHPEILLSPSLTSLNNEKNEPMRFTLLLSRHFPFFVFLPPH